jgi:integrase
MSRKKKCWSQSVGVYGSRVRVAERTPGGKLYLLWVDGNGSQQKRALGHADRKIGKSEAVAFASRIAGDRDSVECERLTLTTLFDIYEANGLHGRTERHRSEVTRKLALWRSFLGGERRVESLSPSDVERFVEARRLGVLRPANATEGRVVGMTTIWHDFVALTTALHFATRHRDTRGKPLLVGNPLTGVRVPKTVSPARPVADDGVYELLRAVAPEVNGHVGLALDLASSTGHRIDAILKLRWDDVSFVRTPHAPHGTLRWRGENDKIDNEHTVPMNELASTALLLVARDRQAIGAAWIFPSETDDSRPVDRHLANRWLRRVEKLANVDHVAGRGWHAFRRGWASARKHLPDVDVAAAGGWKDTATMKRCYQHADAVGVLRVVTEPIRRISGDS